MVFSSPYFIFIFLPIALIVCLACYRRGYLPALALVSLLFYFWSNGLDIFLLLSVIVGNYVGALLLARYRYRALLYLLILANVLLLARFKYLFFLTQNIQSLTGLEVLSGASKIILPAGLSFFIFQAISYLVDVWRGDIPAERRFFRYAAYQSFFPHLIAGPIVRFRDVIGDFIEPKLSVENFGSGVTRFAHGLFKKTIIADGVAPIADAIFVLPGGELNFANAWVGATAYALQIYFDFSGYSDMAIGMAQMFGIHFKENFVRPYSSRSLTEFWRRRHISLSSWFRDYVYFPLGGNRHGTITTYRNLLIVFLVTGLWHGAAWNFVIWGIYHGFFLILERAALSAPLEKMQAELLRYVYCLPVVIFGWVLFRAGTLEQTGQLWLAMAQPWTLIPLNDLMTQAAMTPDTILSLLLGSVIFILPRRASFGSLLSQEPRSPFGKLVNVGYTAVALVSASILILSGNYSPFLYFQF